MMGETYIRMCDCPEIQGRKPTDGENSFTHRWHGIDTDRISSTSHEDYRGVIIYPFEKRYIWLPRQEDWQNILFSRHYAPAIPNTVRKIQAAMIIMHREFVDYMEAWKIDQPCEAWVRLYMNRAHNKTWTEKGWA